MNVQKILNHVANCLKQIEGIIEAAETIAARPEKTFSIYMECKEGVRIYNTFAWYMFTPNSYIKHGDRYGYHQEFDDNIQHINRYDYCSESFRKQIEFIKHDIETDEYTFNWEYLRELISIPHTIKIFAGTKLIETFDMFFTEDDIAERKLFRQLDIENGLIKGAHV